MGIRRPAEIAEITGYDATVLWAKYLRGDKKALRQLIQYNTEDVVHLKAIMEIAYDRLAGQTGEFLKPSQKPIFKGVPGPPTGGGERREAAPATNPGEVGLRYSGSIRN